MKKKNNINPEIDLKSSPISSRNCKRYSKKDSSICKIFTDKGCGTGFICEVKIKDKKIKFLFTNNHIINKDQINNIGSNILIFNDDEEKNNRNKR